MSHATTKTATYTTKSKSRGCAEFGPTDLTYTDTISEDGRVVSTVRGYNDGEYVDSKSERQIPTPVDFARIDEARRTSGWLKA